MANNNIAYKDYGPKTRRKQIILSALILLLIFALGASYYYFFIMQKAPLSAIDEANLEVYMDGDYYLGNSIYAEGLTKTPTFNIASLLGYSEGQATFESLDSSIASISNEMITINNTGTLGIRINGEERTFFVVEGINVSLFSELFYAIEEELPIVLQANIDLIDPRGADLEIEPTNEDQFHLKADFYGNGYDIDCTKVLSSPYDAAFLVKASNLTIRDTHFFGVKLEQGASLEDLEQSGAILSVEGSTESPISGITVENCILENAHRCIFINSADITIQGCIIRNASDSTVSVQTNNDSPSNITIKNCAMANSVVSCITFWCMDEIANEDNFVTLNFEGFFDCYNWKDVESARIMPRTEPLEIVVKPIITSNMRKPIYQAFYYPFNGNNYLHAAIMIIATPPCNGNYPIINGLEALGYQKRDFPLPEVGKKFIKTLNLCGYVDNPSIEPDSSLGDNAKLYEELRYGRD